MKRTKRMLALVLAMMMAFSMLAIPAAAHGDEDEGIMPLYDIIPCPSPNCNGYRTKTQEHGTLYRGETCSNIPDEKHFHEVTGIFEIVDRKSVV